LVHHLPIEIFRGQQQPKDISVWRPVNIQKSKAELKMIGEEKTFANSATWNKGNDH
jgi:hypothetical protein